MVCGPAADGAAADYTWNSTGTDWTAASSWSPAGPPGSGDDAFFTPGGASTGTAAQNPIISANEQVKSLTIAPNQNLGGWAFSGAGSLTLGGAGSTGLTTYGPATSTFDGLTLMGAGAGGSVLNFNVTTGSVLVLSGNTTVAQNFGVIYVNGGTMRVDNSTTAANDRFAGASSSTITVNAGGTFELIGHSSAAVSQAVGTLAAGTDNIAGVNTFRVTPNGQATTLTFANSDASGFSTRPGRYAVYQFAASSGNLGGADGARVTFVGTPFLGANGLLANTSGGAGFGYAIATDAGGTDFATWTAADGIKRAGFTQQASTVGDITSTDNTSRIHYTPTANDASSSNLTVGSFRITPSAAGISLSMGSGNLVTNALMLNGANDFAITGTGTLGAAGPRYVYVNDASATLSTSLTVASGTNPTVFAGPGFVELTGATSQNTLSGANRFVIAGGTVRANNTQVGFTSSGAGVLSLTGGVLEIKGGTNGAGSSADFTRGLGSTAGNVTWGAGTSNEIGGGGFSAHGSAASVNIGGQSTPDALRWGQTNFVADGYALTFGSTKSNAVLTFLNPLQLDSATGSSYQLREVRVLGGAGGDGTVLAGTISGAANADLIKTGTGTLWLTGVNTYQGNTLVGQGTLLAANPAVGSATGTGAVGVHNGGTLGGDNAGAISGAVTVAAGGTIAPGLGGTTTGILSTAGGVTFLSGSAFSVDVSGSGAGTGYDQLSASGGAIVLNGTLSVRFDDAFTPTGTERLFIVSNTGSGSLTGTFSNYASSGSLVATHGGFDWRIYYGSDANVWGATNGNAVVLVPVPEPAHLLAACAAFGGAGYALRRLRSRK